MSELSESIHVYHDKMHADHLGFDVDTLPPELLAFRRRLHTEEVKEVDDAWDDVEMGPGAYERDEALAHLLHELADVVIVAFGTADYLGINFDGVLRAVMRANMKKIPPKVPGGKATKPDGWIPADDVILELIKITRRNRQAEIDQFAAAPTKRADYRQPYGPVFTAQFDSLCGECDDEIEEGDRARMGSDGAVHAECVSPV